MNYVTPIPGNWYRLHDREDGIGYIGNNRWIVFYNGGWENIPYINEKRFYPSGGFRLTEVSPEEVNPYVPEKYKILYNYEIY